MTNVGITALGVSIIFVATCLGSSLVFLFKKPITPKINTLFLGIAAGIMLAASIWSLLIPAIEQAEPWDKISFIPVAIGFIAGGLFLVLIDKVVPHIHKSSNIEEGVKSSLNKNTKFFLAVTIHNIPEGLAVGFAYSVAVVSGETAAYMAALGLSIGLAIQNFPEGAAVSLPLKNETGSRWKAFLYGAGSGIVEPIFALLGIWLATSLTSWMPWLLSFAAGAMIFVVAEDLIPDAQIKEYPHLGTWSIMGGFVIMMILEVTLG